MSPDLETQIAALPKTSECSRHNGETCNIDTNRTRSHAEVNQFYSVRPFYFRCQKCDEEAKDNRERALIECGVPARLAGATLENFEPEDNADREALKSATSFVDAGRGFLFIVGDIGRGKSHLATGIIRRFKDPRFIRQAQLLQMRHDSYGTTKPPTRWIFAKVLIAFAWMSSE